MQWLITAPVTLTENIQQHYRCANHEKYSQHVDIERVFYIADR